MIQSRNLLDFASFLAYYGTYWLPKTAPDANSLVAFIKEHPTQTYAHIQYAMWFWADQDPSRLALAYGEYPYFVGSFLAAVHRDLQKLEDTNFYRREIVEVNRHFANHKHSIYELARAGNTKALGNACYWFALEGLMKWWKL